MKRILILLCSAAAGLVAGQATWSQERPVTLEECLSLAKANYPEIRKYDLIRQSEQYTLSNAGKAWLPQVTLSGQATWQNDVPSFPKELTAMISQYGLSIPGLQKDQYKVAVEVSQTIWDGGKTKADNEVTRAETAEQALSTDVEMYDVEGRVEDIYFGILLLQESMRQADITLGLLQSNLDRINSLLKSGEAMQSDADAVEAQLLTARQQKTKLEAALKSYRLMLGIFTGRDMGEGEFVLPSAEMPLYDKPQRKELDLIDAQIRSLDARERVVRASTMPQFGFFAQGYYGYPGMNYFQSMLDDDWSWNAQLGVRMVWNFGAFYTKKNSLRQIQNSKRQAEVRRDIFLFNNSLQAAQESGEIEQLRLALADDDRIVELRSSVRKSAESKLRNGIIDTTDLLGKISDEAAAASNRAARKIELAKKIFELKHTVNK